MPKRKAKKRKYGSKFYRILPVAVFVIAGAFYLAAPYALIKAFGLDFGALAGDQYVMSAILFVIGGLFWAFGKKRKS